MKMKLVRLAIVCVVALGLTATNALATGLTVGDLVFYVGSIVPGTPANPTQEVAFINQLKSMAISTVEVDGGKTYTRSANYPFPQLPTATLTGAFKDDAKPAFQGINVSGFAYILGKYGQDAHVWYVAELATVDIPSTLGQGGGLSHFSLYKSTTSVPDGGVTLMLLGGALVGLETLRRKFRA